MRDVLRTAMWILVVVALAPALVAIPEGWDVAAQRLPWQHIAPLVSLCGVLLVFRWLWAHHKAAGNGAKGGRASGRRR